MNTSKPVSHMEESKVNIPEMGKNTIEFTQKYNQQVEPYIIYAYFEALMNKISEEKTIHGISGFWLVVVSPYEESQCFFSQRGKCR